MADIIGGFTFTVNNETSVIKISDANPYFDNGVVNGTTINLYLKKLTSPNGTVVHENPVVDGVPDVSYAFAGFPNGSISVPIPTYDDGTPQFGNYIVEFEAVVGADNYKKDKTFTYLEYATPTAQLTITADTVTPLFTVEDTTDYVLPQYGDLEPSVAQSTRLITIEFPNNIIADLTGSAATLSTETFYSKTQTVTLTRDITYFVGNDSDFFIVDQVNLTVTEEVVLPYDLCTISALVDNLYAQLTNAENFSNDQTNIRAKWYRAVGLLVMIREALSCGYKEGLDAYAEEVKSLASYCDDVPDDDAPILISGLSAFDNNTLTVGYATDTSGTNLAFTPFDGHSYYAFFPHNKKYTPIASDFNGLWIEKPEGGGGGADLNGTAKTIPMFDSNGTNVEDSIIKQVNNSRIKVGDFTINVGNGSGQNYSAILPPKSGVIAYTSDIGGTPDLSNQNILEPEASYVSGDDIYFITEDAKVEYYKVLQDFSTTDQPIDTEVLINGGDIELVLLANNTVIPEFNLADKKLFNKDSVVYEEKVHGRVYYAALKDNSNISITETNTWKPIAYSINDSESTNYSLYSSSRVDTLLAAKPELGESSSTAYRGDRGLLAYLHSLIITENPHNVLASQITDFNSGVEGSELTGLSEIAEPTEITTNDTVITAFSKIKAFITSKLDKALTTGKMLLGVGGVATEIDTNELYAANDTTQVYTIDYLNTTYPSAVLGQHYENNFQVAIKTQISWLILPKTNGEVLVYNAAQLTGGGLLSTVNYRIIGNIDMGANAIEVPADGLKIIGLGSGMSSLTSSENAYTMFVDEVANESGFVDFENLTLTTSGTTSKLFNLSNSVGANSPSARFIGVNFSSCTEIGEFDSYGQFFANDIGWFGCAKGFSPHGSTGGFKFTDILVKSSSDLFNEGIALTIDNRFFLEANIDMPTGTSHILNFQSSNITDGDSLQLNNCLVKRNGVFNSTDVNYFPNINQKNIKSYWKDNTGIKNTDYEGALEWDVEDPTSLTVNVYSKASGTTTALFEDHFDASTTDNRILSTGEVKRDYRVKAFGTLTGTANNVINIELRDYESGGGSFNVIRNISRTITSTAGTDRISFQLEGYLSDWNDSRYVELWVRNTTSGNSVTFELGTTLKIERR